MFSSHCSFALSTTASLFPPFHHSCLPVQMPADAHLPCWCPELTINITVSAEQCLSMCFLSAIYLPGCRTDLCSFQIRNNLHSANLTHSYRKNHVYSYMPDTFVVSCASDVTEDLWGERRNKNFLGQFSVPNWFTHLNSNEFLI